MSVLSDAVITRIGTQRLVELTQENGSLSTIDLDVLLAACDDAIGDFQRESGMVFSETNSTHIAIAVQGVIFFLEDYKARDGGIMTNHGKRFYAALKSLREKVVKSTSTNSVLVPSQERPDMPDMDRARPAWKYGRKSITLQDISGDE